jgi:hypothetical protein
VNKPLDDLRKFRGKLKAEDRLTRDEANAREGVNERVKAVLEGKLSPDALTKEEYEICSALFMEKMARPGPQEKVFFAERRRKGLGVGLDENGKLVRGSDQ